VDNIPPSKADIAKDFYNPNDETEHSKNEVTTNDFWAEGGPCPFLNAANSEQSSSQYDAKYPPLPPPSQRVPTNPSVPQHHPKADHEKAAPPLSNNDNTTTSINIKNPEIVFIVIDTNVLILDLDFLKSNFRRPNIKIYVPWQVLQEIGELEKRPSPQLAQKARNASRFLDECFHELDIQNGEQEYQIPRTFWHICNDDKILQTVLYLRHCVGNNNVRLWSYDRTFVVKARAHHINIFMSVPTNIESVNGKSYCKYRSHTLQPTYITLLYLPYFF